MTDRYARIRAALAMEPTPGPWGLTELPRDMQRYGYKFSISRGGLGWWIAKVTHEANGGSGVANATYIAACDPDTIRDLLAERDALEAENERLHEQLRLATVDQATAEAEANDARAEIEALRAEVGALRREVGELQEIRSRSTMNLAMRPDGEQQ